MAICPVCKKDEVGVEKITVANHVKESCWLLREGKYWICEDQDCDVVYFSISRGRTLKTDDVKNRVTFKEK